MKQRDRELCLKEWYRPYYYEWLINEALWKHVDAHRLVLRGYKRGGKIRGGKKTLEKIARQTLIKQTEEKLNTDGVKKLTNKRIAREIPGENEGYIQKFRAKRNKEKKSRR